MTLIMENMSVKWSCTFKNIEDRSYLEDLLPKNEHFSILASLSIDLFLPKSQA